MNKILRFLASCLVGGIAVECGSQILINEIMYHPYHILPAGENPAQEWIELYNKSTNTINLAGWKLTRGIEFTFTNATIAPDSYLVVAADVTVFKQLYPAVTNVVGGWSEKLANTRNQIDLVNPSGEVVCSVTYADSGEWAIRQRGQLMSGYRGWTWLSEADGGGKSLELINPFMPAEYAQNWSASTAAGGTPGSRNSVFRTNTAPLILDVAHSPVIPQPTNSVIITARILDELPNGVFSVFLYYRNASTTTPPPFSSTQMYDDGRHNDNIAGDGIYGAAIPSNPHGTVIEYYIEARDTSGNSREWPERTLDENNNRVRECNALFQVDTNVYTGTMPLYRIIMTATERQELQAIHSGRITTDAQMNGSFISIDSRGAQVRHRIEIRLRGAGSRFRTPPSYRINFPKDNLWYGVSAVNLNSQFPHAQLAGSILARLSGLPTENHSVVQVRLNGINPHGATSLTPYIHQEVPNSEFAANHFPQDPNGNIYRASTGSHNADLSYQGTNIQAYINRGYSKTSNQSENDWSDLIQLTDILSNTPDATYGEAVRRVVNVEEWMLYFALFTLTTSMETSLGTGRGDDYMLYRGINDPRFLLMGHDWDTILGQGDTAGDPSINIFRMVPNCNCNPSGSANVAVLNRFMWHPEFVPIYFKTLKRLIETTFAPENLGAVLDQHLSSFASQAAINSMKNFAALRCSNVLAQIPLKLTVSDTLPVQNGYRVSTTPTISLRGNANAIDTRSVRVNGQVAQWTAYSGRWSISSLQLNPGINRILIQSFNSTGSEIERMYYDVWYNTGSIVDINYNITTNTVWQAASGPYRIVQSIQIPTGITLTIEPGVTVYFSPGVTLNFGGALIVNGTDTQRVRFTMVPGSGSTNGWGGLFFFESDLTNRLSYLDIEFAGSSGRSIILDNAILIADNLTFSGTTAGTIETTESSLHIKNSIFPTISNAEHIHGNRLPANGFLIIENNIFGGTTGLNDIIDFTGGKRPGPILQVLNNIFTYASDDVLDLDGTDAHIEGNIFMNVHQRHNRPADTSSAISGGRDGTNTSDLVIVRNLFYDCDHAILAKENNYYTIVNNTMVKMTQSAINFDEPGRRSDGVTPGRGAYLDGNIIWQTATNFENVYINDPTFGTTQLTVNRCIMSGNDFLTNGVGNMQVDPRLVNTINVTYQTIWNDFSLREGSPAKGAGPNGIDIGGVVPQGASISGEPPNPTYQNFAVLTIGGPGITHYKYRINASPYTTEEFPVSQPLVLSNLPNGNFAVYVLGKNSVGVWQTQPSYSKNWVVNTNLSRLIINEVLAKNQTAVTVGSRHPDMIELYNAGGTTLDLSNMSISDDPSVPRKFVFPEGIKIKPGEYLVLYADNTDIGDGTHIGFALNDDGDGVYLYDKPSNGGNLIDSVVFGLQLADYSIGRLPNGTWGLTLPTFGSANIQAKTGERKKLKINEWLAFQGVFFANDFIEIYNPDILPVRIDGLMLSDCPQVGYWGHTIPPLSFIGANGFRVFIADGNPQAGNDHLSFRLSTFEGLIALLESDGTVIDAIRYGPQFPDVSSGRSPDGSGQIVLFNQPTPGAGNPAQAYTITTLTNSIIRFNDLWKYEASGTDLGTAWRAPNYNDSAWQSGQGMFYHGSASFGIPINTVLPYTSPQQITFYFRKQFVYTGPTNGVVFVITHIIDDGAVFYLNGQEFYRTNIGITVSVSYNTLANSVSGNAVLDGPVQVPLPMLVQGTNVIAVEVHQSSSTSSDIAFAFSLDALTYTTNYISIPVVINEVLAKNMSYTNASGKAVDWVELYNPSSVIIDLSDMSLSDDFANPRKWTFPAGANIAPGGFYVVEFDDSAPYTPFNAGFELSANSGSVYLFSRPTEGMRLIDSINYGIQIADYAVGRSPDGMGQWRLCFPTRGSANIVAPTGSPAVLKINEWMPDPDNGDDWFELYNPGSLPVDLSGLHLTDNLANPTKNRIPPLSFIGTGSNAYVVFYADGNQYKGAHHTNFKLDNTKEVIGLFGTELNLPPLIDAVQYLNPQKAVSEGRLVDGSTNIVRFVNTPSPGMANYLIKPDILINEVLAHTDPPLEDAIEIRNLTDLNINISGWFLSDSASNLKKYQFPEGTILPANGYIVVYEYQFNPTPGSPGSFALSSTGDEIWLSEATGSGQLTGYRAYAKFGASPSGVSFGNYETSLGNVFVAMSQRTFGSDAPRTVEEFRLGNGAPNSYPLVGPVVINEIHYHPPDIDTNNNVIDEFIELLNISTTPVPLFDPDYPTNGWRIRDAVDFDFPTEPQNRIILPPQGFLLIVSFDPIKDPALLSAFKQKYGVPDNIPIAGPYSGKLANNNDNVELYRPDTPQLQQSDKSVIVPYILVERVRYSDAPPWPTAADGNTNGLGLSLQRKIPNEFGNDPVNWVAAPPTPGAPNQPAYRATPTITQQPSSLTIQSGSNAVLSVISSGATPLGYLWRFNGAILPNETNSVLIISNATASHSGRYSVIVYNDAGSTLSAEAILTVTTPPIIYQQPESRTVLIGSDVLFSVSAGGKDLAYQWRFNGTNIPGATSQFLLITNTQPFHSGNYDVIITNQQGITLSETATLLVVVPPSITQNPADQSVFAGRNIQFAVQVSGTAPLYYQWYYNDSIIPGATNSILTLTNIQPQNAGQYYVVVSNWGGYATSSVATLTVIVPPIVNVTATIQSVVEGAANQGQFTITRTAGTNYDLTLSYSVGGTAIAGSDYQPLPSTLTIPKGAYEISIPVITINDSIREGDETVILTLLFTTNYDTGVSYSATITIYDDDNSQPQITLLTPTNDTVYPITPTNILISASATDPDGSIARVEFYAGTNKLGETLIAPYTLVWTNAIYGTNILIAKAIDDLGASASSAPVSVIVNRPPIVGITTPNDGSAFIYGVPIPVNIFANDLDGSITNITLFLGTNRVATLTNSPYQVMLTNLASGSHTLLATASDNLGMSTTSSPVIITISSPGLFDDFEPDIDRSQWSSFGGTIGQTVIATNYGGIVSGVNSLWFGGDNQRYAITRSVNTIQGGQVIFYLRISNGGSEPWETADLPDEGVVLEYSTNNGSTWVEIGRFDTFGAPYTTGWDLQQIPIPASAQTTNTLFRWRQLSHSGSCCDHWAIDDVQIVVGPTAPFITAHPTDATAIVGGTVTFSVSAGGSLPLFYQWLFNNTPIPGKTNSTLSIDNVSMTNAGLYSVVISNSLGSAVSRHAKLTVVEATIDTFRIVRLTAEGAYAIEHNSITGDDRGGIAVSDSQVFVTGDSSTGRFSANDLSGGTALNTVYDSLCSDLRTEKVYLLANGNIPLTSSGGTANRLLELNGASGLPTGNFINLSAPIQMSGYGNIGIFSGFGRIVIHNGTRVYNILIPSGAVTDLGAMNVPTHTYSENWAFWGVAEYYAGVIYLVYARNSTTISRTRVPDGLTETVATFNNLSDMASFTVSLRRGRWYFHCEYDSQFRSGDETLGFANAVFEYNVGTNVPPNIALQPQDLYVSRGSVATFSVLVYGTSPLYYQWQFNGTNISGAVQSSFVIENVQPEHVGEYRVIITNAFGSVTSDVARLIIATPIQIIEQPQSQTIFAGTNVILNVVVTGTEPITYQWRYAPINDPADVRDLVNQTNATLILSNTTYYHSGYYNVIVSNPISTNTSATATVIVLSPPFFIQAPVSRQFVTGMIATLEAVVDGSQPIFYQWRKDGAVIPGATNSVLSFPNAQTNVAGAYDFIATNLYGSITSTVAYITFPPLTEDTFVITSLKNSGVRTIDVYPQVGYGYFDGMAVSETRLIVNGYSGAASYSLQDLGDPRILTGNMYGLVSDLKTQKAYILANRGNMIYYYGGTVDSLIEVDELTGALTTNVINLSTNIYISPDGGIFSGYGRVVIVQYSGFNSRVYNIDLPGGKVTEIGIVSRPIPYNYDNSFYLFYGLAETLGTNLYIVYVKNDQRTIERMRLPDGDTYPVSTFANLGYMGNLMASISRNRWYFRQYGISQFGGTSTSSETVGYANASFAYLISTSQPPVIVEQPQSVKATVGGSVTLRVIASGTLPLSYQWYRNNQPIENQTNSTIFLANMRQNVAGAYFVTVSNVAGVTTSAVATLTVDYGAIGYITNSFIPMDYVWKYNQTSAYTSTNPWVSPTFDDSTWQSGPALLYVETNSNVNPKNTPLTIGRYTYYFRTTIVINTNPADFVFLAKTMIDDGAIIYVNGREIQRVRFTSAPYYYNFASSQPPGGDAVLEQFMWKGTNFVQGTNYIAVEVHQDNSSSSDIVWGMALDILTPIPALPPVITNQPVSQAVNIGGSATFSVGATGTPPLYYQWRFNGMNIPGAQNRTLTLTNVTQKNAGHYTVIVRNNYDLEISQPAALIVNAAPLLSLPSQPDQSGFRIFIHGNPGRSYELQTSSNLIDWLTLTTFTNSNGQIDYFDTDYTNYNYRFYRAKQIQ